MKKTLFVLAISCILFVTASADRLLASSPKSFDRAGVQGRFPVLKSQPGENPAGLHVDFGSLPLYFTANRGQVDGRALFYAKAARYTLWLTGEGFVFDSFMSESAKAPTAGKEPPLRLEKRESRRYKRDVSRLVFLHAAKHPQIIPVDETALRVNYFIGNDPKKWHTAVPTAKAVLYKNIYKNIDLKVYGVESRIEYDWIVRPGGDPRDIKFEYRNVKGTRLDDEGNLLVQTRFGELVHKKPATYQQTGGSGNGTRAAVESAFKKIGKNAYGFEVGAYEPGRELIIDPVVLAYSSYLGGSGVDYADGIAVDGSGNAYMTGQTASTNFPTLNQYQTDQTNSDAFVTKIDTTQSGNASLVYSTYLGGDGDDNGYGIAVDSSGNAYVIGYTDSTDFPTLNQYQTDQAGSDAFVTKIDTTQSGNASLVYSTYLGGDDDDNGLGIAVDSSGNAYVTGYTYSTDFPTLNQYQTDQAGEDAFVTKIDTIQSGSASLAYSTYLGGNANDNGSGIAVDNGGNAYVTGSTSSTNFPTLNPYQTYPGDDDNNAFVTRIDTTQSGSAGLVYSTYLGGDDGDSGKGIAVDNSGNVYVTGYTNSTDFPTLNPYQTYPDDEESNVFVTRIDTTQSGSAGLVYSTYLGGDDEDIGRGIAVDNSGNAYVTGETYSTDFPTLDQYHTDQGSSDAFVTKIATTQSGSASLVYSTYLGGNDDDMGRGIAVDNSGNAYVTGFTYSTDFPTLNQYQTDQAGNDAFIAKLVNAQKDDFLATWDGQGVYYRNSDSGAWVKLATPATLIAAGDLDNDAIDDLIGIWPGQGGVWVKYSATGSWAKLSTTARHIASGDMNGDGRPELLGTWDGQGVYWRNNTTGAWTKLATPATLITSGDLDGDNIDDLIGIWPSQGGVWVKYSQSGAWAKLSTTAMDIAAGDMNGDGRDDLLATWDGQGVYYRNSIGGAWVKMATPATQVTAGDLDGDGTDDVIGIWPSQAGVWVKYSQTGVWAKLSTTAVDIAAGRMRAAGSASLTEPGALVAGSEGDWGPDAGADAMDLSANAPGGMTFACSDGENLEPREPSNALRVPGPGEIGFQCQEQKNLVPGSETTKEVNGKEQRQQK